MRGSREIWFRLRQETSNLGMRWRLPRMEAHASAPVPGLPDPARIAARLRGTPFALDLERLAEQIDQPRAWLQEHALSIYS